MKQVTLHSAGCNNYLPYGSPAPNTDCNMPCKPNTSVLCGVGNRIAVYQNTNVTLLNHKACIVGSDFTNFHLQAVPVTGNPPSAIPGGPIRQVYAITVNFNGNTVPQYTILSVRATSNIRLFEYALASKMSLRRHVRAALVRVLQFQPEEH